MATPPPREKVIRPPQNDPPMTDKGWHSEAWAGYHEDISNGLIDLKAEVRAKLGVTDGSDADAGQIGEFLTATFSGVSLPNGTPVDVGTLALTAGDWDVSGVIQFTPGVGTTFNHLVVGIDPAAGTIGDIRQELYAPFPAGAGGASIYLGTGAPVRISSASAETAHISALANFIGSMVCGGTMTARRMR